MSWRFITLIILAATQLVHAQRLGDYWGTAAREAEYYRVVDLPMPDDIAIEAGSFEVLDDDRLAVGTRRGDIYIVSGAFDSAKRPTYHRYASGLDEVFGLDYRDGSFYIAQQTEITRVTDTDGDNRADKFETLNDDWGFAHYHEFSWGSDIDPEGNIWIALGLSSSYHSKALFRGWCLKVNADTGKMTPVASGLRSPGNIGPNEHGVMFYVESQGPWNGSCSLKFLKQGGFMGHPVSFNWYEFAPSMGPAPVVPNTNSRLEVERKRVKELVPYAVVFPYRKMGQSIGGFRVDRTGGKFGPFENQIFVGDYSQSVVMRATTELVNGVWQGACYPFREGLSTGLLAVQFTPKGQLIVGGTSRGWPVRGPNAFALQRLEWTGKTPFEIKIINAEPDGFTLTFTKPVDRSVASKPGSYSIGTYTHIYRQGYGSPEVDQTTPKVTSAVVSDDGLRVRLKVDGLVQGHVHEFDVSNLRSNTSETPLHIKAYYTLNEIPKK